MTVSLRGHDNSNYNGTDQEGQFIWPASSAVRLWSKRGWDSRNRRNFFETTADWPKCVAHLHKRGFPAAASNISVVSGFLGIVKVDRVWPYELSFVDSY